MFGFDYFFSRLGRGIRYTLTCAGAIACVPIIILGTLGITTVIIPICGGIALIPMGLVMFENVKVIRDMEKLVSQFKNEMKLLRDNNEKLSITNSKLEETADFLDEEVDELKVVKNDLTNELKKLQLMLAEGERKIILLKNLGEDYQKHIKNLKNNLEEANQNNLILGENVAELIQLKNQIKEENKLLEDKIRKINNQLLLIQEQELKYEEENIKLQNSNTLMGDNIDNLKNELDKIKQSYQESKEVIEVLIRSKNVLNDIYNDMMVTEEKTDQNVTLMSKLLDIFQVQRSEELFEKLDINKDGKLEKDEFVDIV